MTDAKKISGKIQKQDSRKGTKELIFASCILCVPIHQSQHSLFQLAA